MNTLTPAILVSLAVLLLAGCGQANQGPVGRAAPQDIINDPTFRCSLDLSVRIKEIRGDPQVCLVTGVDASVRSMLENMGTVALAGLDVILLGEGDEIFSTTLTDTLPPADIKRYDIAYPYEVYGDIHTAELTPLIASFTGAGTIRCPDATLIIEQISPCP